MALLETILNQIATEIELALTDAAPKLILAAVFLVLAYIGISIVLKIVRSVLDRLYNQESDLVVTLLTTIVGILLWFGAGLTVLKIVGMGEVAASLGTAAGFIALGISYALSNMIADTVAGVYLLRDPDFNIGDRVTADSVTGTVTAIELRKSRFELEDGNTIVVANRDVEKRWTRLEN
jgi:small-conductance mechanosensitive channel